jgi:hypothetical protein
MTEWRMEEQQVKMAIQGLSSTETGDRALYAQKTFELAEGFTSGNNIHKISRLKIRT